MGAGPVFIQVQVEIVPRLTLSHWFFDDDSKIYLGEFGQWSSARCPRQHITI
jgi:hypothetical protein